MSSGQDEVLSLADSDDKSFSGFDPSTSEDDVPDRKCKNKNKKAKKMKSVVKKVAPTKEKGKKVGRAHGQDGGQTSAGGQTSELTKNDNSYPLDFSKLSASEIHSLRDALGIIPNEHIAQDDDFNSMCGGGSYENIRVELDRNDVSSDGELAEPNSVPEFQSAFNRALFDENSQNTDENLWGLPQLKAPLRGAPVSHSLASMINVACTSQCDVEPLLVKYKVPENCDKAGPPMVNNEVWKVMDRRSQSLDRGIVETQNLVAAGITPIIKLAETLKQHISSNPEAKSMISDALVMLGQVQYSLSVKRRYMIRPVLKKKYHSLCNVSMPISDKLFGDDVSKCIKACDSMAFIGKDQGFQGNRNLGMRGRGTYNNRLQRRGYSGSQSYGGPGSYRDRYQPYPIRGQYRPYPARNSGYRIPKKSATATAPNPNDRM